MNPILQKFERRSEVVSSLLCVGLDPEIGRIPARFLATSMPQLEFGKWILEQTAPYAAAVKPNIAFYEARGAQGLRELELTMEYIREHHPQLMTICDAKRGDIGSTNEAYAAAVFDRLGFDAITLHPYLGREALAPFLERRDKACIVLCRTSNPGAGEFQDLESTGKPLWQAVAEQVSRHWNADGNCMLVVGATYPEEMRKIREIAPDVTFLVPGIGAQGGDLHAAVAAGIDAAGKGLIINSARAIIFSENPAAAACELRDAINEARGALNASR